MSSTNNWSRIVNIVENANLKREQDFHCETKSRQNHYKG